MKQLIDILGSGRRSYWGLASRASQARPIRDVEFEEMMKASLEPVEKPKCNRRRLGRRWAFAAANGRRSNGRVGRIGLGGL